ncbi:hypothetical protein BaRGS_00035287, partial [Batillaria attramentaria]
RQRASSSCWENCLAGEVPSGARGTHAFVLLSPQGPHRKPVKGERSNASKTRPAALSRLRRSVITDFDCVKQLEVSLVVTAVCFKTNYFHCDLRPPLTSVTSWVTLSSLGSPCPGTRYVSYALLLCAVAVSRRTPVLFFPRRYRVMLKVP